jgi:DNA-binding HxlR family transcriptional regulator
MRTARIADPRVCSIDEAMHILGAKWAVVAIREISFGQHRFDEIVSNTGAPRDILATRLRELEEAGLIVREQYSEKPPRYEYLLTKAGSDLFMVLNSIREWGDQHVRKDPENIVTVNHSCGAQLASAMVCTACGGEVLPSDIAYTRDLHRSQIEHAH